MSVEQTQEVTVITKPAKHPGRVAWGHKLAALKKMKKDLKQQEGTVESPVKTSSGATVQSGSVYL